MISQTSLIWSKYAQGDDSHSNKDKVIHLFSLMVNLKHMRYNAHGILI